MKVRKMMLRVGLVINAEQNKGDKMEMLDLSHGTEFRMHIEATVQSFSKMKGDIAAERRAYERVWNEREKNLDLVMRNTSQMFGTIKGIEWHRMLSIQYLRC